MALTQLTKVDGGGISTTSDYRVGIITAIKFVGPFDGTGGNFTGVVTASSAIFAGDVSIGGTLTYEDVTNIDSVGIITAKKDIHVGAGISAVGVITGRYLNPSSVSTQNVIIGWEQSTRNVTGNWNVLLGRRAGEGLTSGGSAVCIGANAGQLLGSSSGIFIGGQAGARVTGSNNLFIGGNAGSMTTSAAACTIIGNLAGIDNQGNENTLVGFYAGRGNSGVTDGTRNTFLGSQSGFKIEGGDDNTGVGRYSLLELLGGNKNVAIGQQAGDALVSGNNNIIIGYQADASTSTTSNEITLGDANINHLRIPGIGVSFNSTGGTQLGIITATELNIADSIIHQSDTDTKIRFPAANTFSVETGGNERFRIASDGQNTIYSGAHDKGLDILPVGNSQETRLRIQAKNSSGTEHTFSFNAKQSANVLHISGTGPICFIGSQNVGVQNGVPTSPLHVGDDTNPHSTKALLFVGPASGDGTFHLRGGSPTVFFDSTSGGDAKILIDGRNLIIKDGTIGNDGTELLRIDSNGHLLPGTDSQYNIGSSSVRFANIYADTLYGDGSNLTGIAADKIFENNSKVEVVDTGTGYITAEVDGTERLRVNSSGIDVSGEIELDNGGSAGLNFKRSGTLKADIEIGSASDELAIRARGSGGFILLSTNSINAFRLNSSGHFDLGRDYSTNPSNGLVGITTIRGHRVNSAGDYARLYFKNSTVSGSSSASIRAYRDNGNYNTGFSFYTNYGTSSGGDGQERFLINSLGTIVKQTFSSNQTYAANDTTQLGYQSQNISDVTNTYTALRLTAGNSSPATAQLSSIRTGSGQNDFTIQLETGNTAFEALRIKSNGNVLIGTSADGNQALTVYKPATAAILIQNTSTGTGGGNGLYLGNGNSTISYIWNYENDSMRLATNNTERIRITNTGQVNIGGDYAQTTYTMKVTGSFAATTKSFVIDHPTKEKHKLRYACLEGPENSVYIRGKTSDSVIELPDYWTGLVHEDSITVNVTPIGNHKVWVESINNNSVKIGSDGSEYFYTVFAERKDVDKLEVEVEE